MYAENDMFFFLSHRNDSFIKNDNIKTRIGFHDVDGQKCSMNGLLILELTGETAICEQLADELAGLEGVEVQKMIFDHD